MCALITFHPVCLQHRRETGQQLAHATQTWSKSARSSEEVVMQRMSVQHISETLPYSLDKRDLSFGQYWASVSGIRAPCGPMWVWRTCCIDAVYSLNHALTPAWAELVLHLVLWTEVWDYGWSFGLQGALTCSKLLFVFPLPQGLILNWAADLPTCNIRVRWYHHHVKKLCFYLQ